MGCIIVPEDYSLSTECILNFTTLINSYNNEWWFLFPYLLLVFTCKPFFQNHSPIIAKTRLDINSCLVFFHLNKILTPHDAMHHSKDGERGNTTGS